MWRNTTESKEVKEKVKRDTFGCFSCLRIFFCWGNAKDEVYKDIDDDEDEVYPSENIPDIHNLVTTTEASKEENKDECNAFSSIHIVSKTNNKSVCHEEFVAATNQQAENVTEVLEEECSREVWNKQSQAICDFSLRGRGQLVLYEQGTEAKACSGSFGGNIPSTTERVVLHPANRDVILPKRKLKAASAIREAKWILSAWNVIILNNNEVQNKTDVRQLLIGRRPSINKFPYFVCFREHRSKDNVQDFSLYDDMEGSQLLSICHTKSQNDGLVHANDSTVDKMALLSTVIYESNVEDQQQGKEVKHVVYGTVEVDREKILHDVLQAVTGEGELHSQCKSALESTEQRETEHQAVKDIDICSVSPVSFNNSHYKMENHFPYLSHSASEMCQTGNMEQQDALRHELDFSDDYDNVYDTQANYTESVPNATHTWQQQYMVDYGVVEGYDHINFGEKMSSHGRSLQARVQHNNFPADARYAQQFEEYTDKGECDNGTEEILLQASKSSKITASLLARADAFHKETEKVDAMLRQSYLMESEMLFQKYTVNQSASHAQQCNPHNGRGMDFSDVGKTPQYLNITVPHGMGNEYCYMPNDEGCVYQSYSWGQAPFTKEGEGIGYLYGSPMEPQFCQQDVIPNNPEYDLQNPTASPVASRTKHAKRRSSSYGRRRKQKPSRNQREYLPT